MDNNDVIYADGQDRRRIKMLATEDNLKVWKLPTALWHSA